MDTTTRSAVAAAALTLSITPLLLAPPAAAERVSVGERPVKQAGGNAGAPAYRQQVQAYLVRLIAAKHAQDRRAEQPVSPPAPAQAEGDGVPVPVVTVLTLGGLAAGAGAALGLRGTLPRRRQVAV